MDIISSVTLTAFGAFGAGVTVGALVFSPRLVTRVDRPAIPPAGGQQSPTVVHLIPGDSGPTVPAVIPAPAPGITLIPGSSGGFPGAAPRALPGQMPEQIPGQMPGPAAGSGRSATPDSGIGYHYGTPRQTPREQP